MKKIFDTMSKLPKPPKTYSSFIKRFPKLGLAWENITEEGKNGPLNEKTIRLVKLGIAIGAFKEGAVHSNVRKAMASAIPQKEIEQVVALAAGTIGMPSTVAAYSWVTEEIEMSKKKNSSVKP